MPTIHKIQRPQPKIEERPYMYIDLPIEDPPKEEKKEEASKQDGFEVDDFYVSFMI